MQSNLMYSILIHFTFQLAASHVASSQGSLADIWVDGGEASCNGMNYIFIERDLEEAKDRMLEETECNVPGSSLFHGHMSWHYYTGVKCTRPDHEGTCEDESGHHWHQYIYNGESMYYVHVETNHHSCEENGMLRIVNPEECKLAANKLNIATDGGFSWDFPRNNVHGGCIYEVDQGNVDFNAKTANTKDHTDRQVICKVRRAPADDGSVFYVHVQVNHDSCEENGMTRITDANECQSAASKLNIKTEMGFSSDYSRSSVHGGCIYEVDKGDVDFNSRTSNTKDHTDRQVICKVETSRRALGASDGDRQEGRRLLSRMGH